MKFLRWAALLGLLLTAACQPTQNPTPIQTSAPLEAVRITVPSSGWYALNPQAVRSAGLQWEIDQAATLWLGDQLIPLWHPLEMSSDTVLFFIPEEPDRLGMPYTLLFMPDESGSSPLPFETLEENLASSDSQSKITSMIHLEQDSYYDAAAPYTSPWLWQQLSPETGFTTKFMINTPINTGEAQLTLSLWGITASPNIDPDHFLQISINGHDFATESWDGQEEKQINLSFPAEWLAAGENTLTIQIPLAEPLLDLVSLDSIDVRYPAAPTDCRLPETFQASSGSVSLAGCSTSIWLADTQDPSSVWVMGPTANGNITFDLPKSGAYTAGSFSTVSPVEQIEGASLILPAETEDELIIAPQNFTAALQPLVEYRCAQGLSVSLAALEAVENRFTHGSSSVEAIQRYFRQLTTKPKYLLLVGDTSYDIAASSWTDTLPTPMLRTRLGGWTASDRLYLQSDVSLSLPETAVGRIPAASIKELETAVQKILDYERNLSSTVTAAALADPAETGFTGDAEHFLSFFPARNTKILAAGAIGTDLLDQPVQIAAYFGHGSLTTWGSTNLLDASLGANLNRSSPLPVVAQFTCLTGYFIHPSVDSLSEILLFNPRGGASAIFAPSSLSLPSDQNFLAAGLAQAFSSSDALTLGDALLSAWRNAPDESGAQEAAFTFMLLGDPAMRICK